MIDTNAGLVGLLLAALGFYEHDFMILAFGVMMLGFSIACLGEE